jgi:hypothetical protein
MNRSDMETQQTRGGAETLAFIAGFVSARGKVGDGGYPARPWMYFYCTDPAVAQEAREAFGGRVSREERERGLVMWKYYAYGDEALEIIADLVPHFRGQRRKDAERVLERWEGR